MTEVFASSGKGTGNDFRLLLLISRCCSRVLNVEPSDEFVAFHLRVSQTLCARIFEFIYRLTAEWSIDSLPLSFPEISGSWGGDRGGSCNSGGSEKGAGCCDRIRKLAAEPKSVKNQEGTVRRWRGERQGGKRRLMKI